MAITLEPVVNGYLLARLSQWSDFREFIQRYCMAEVSWIFRGQRDAEWKLESSWNRLMNETGLDDTASARFRHLKQFRMAARGIRQPPAPHEKKNEDEPDLYDWALGQHYGLATPLLDWSLYPYVAAFFAFEEAPPPSKGQRAIWALHALSIQDLTKPKLEGNVHWDTVRSLKLIRFFRPWTGENERLLRQNGLFSITPPDLTITDYVANEFRLQVQPVLIKIEMPDSERTAALCELNRMGVNHIALFPDLLGPGRYSNLAASVPGYRL